MFSVDLSKSPDGQWCGLACSKQAWGAAVLRPYMEKPSERLALAV